MKNIINIDLIQIIARDLLTTLFAKEVLKVPQKFMKTMTLFSLYPFLSADVSSDSLDLRTMVVVMEFLKGYDFKYISPNESSNTDDRAALLLLYGYRLEITSTRKFTTDQFEKRWRNITSVSILVLSKCIALKQIKCKFIWENFIFIKICTCCIGRMIICSLQPVNRCCGENNIW